MRPLDLESLEDRLLLNGAPAFAPAPPPQTAAARMPPDPAPHGPGPAVVHDHPPPPTDHARVRPLADHAGSLPPQNQPPPESLTSTRPTGVRGGSNPAPTAGVTLLVIVRANTVVLSTSSAPSTGPDDPEGNRPPATPQTSAAVGEALPPSRTPPVQVAASAPVFGWVVTSASAQPAIAPAVFTAANHWSSAEFGLAVRSPSYGFDPPVLFPRFPGDLPTTPPTHPWDWLLPARQATEQFVHPLPLDLPALEAGVRRFLEGLTNPEGPLLDVDGGWNLSPWLIAAALAAASCEIARRQFRRTDRPAGPGLQPYPDA